MTRQEALAEAMKLVDELAPRTNARGYTDGTIRPAERIELALKVADWLLRGPLHLPEIPSDWLHPDD